MTENEAIDLSKNIDAELEARVINDELDAHAINDSLQQVAETFDALDAEGVEVPAMSPEDYEKEAQLKKFQNTMAKYFKARENHEPGKEFVYSDTTYTVQDKPHHGMWVKKDTVQVVNPNLNNNSVRRKLLKNPKKYSVVNL